MKDFRIVDPFLILLNRRINTIEGNVAKLEGIKFGTFAFDGVLNTIDFSVVKASNSLVAESRMDFSKFVDMLRQALTGVLGITQLLKQLTSHKLAAVKKLIKDLGTATKKAKEISEDAIISLVERGKHVVIKAPDEKDIGAIVQSALNMSKCKKDSFVKCNCEATWIRNNVPDIVRAFINILNNAAEAVAKKVYLEGDDPSIVVTSNVKVEDKRLMVSIADNGIGMTVNTLSQVFDKGFTTKFMSEGTGLHNLKKIIEQIGGSIDIKSKDNQGTTVTLGIPLI